MRTHSHLLILLLATATASLMPAHAQDVDIEAERAEAAHRIPSDKNPMARYAYAGRVVVAYQYRIEFFKDKSIKPEKVLTFKHPFLAFFDRNLLVCTNRFQEYSGQDEHEKRMIAIRGERYDAISWTDPKGEIEQFCGVLSPQGKIIFEFPPQKKPREIYYPIGIANEGNRAAVFIGTAGPSKHPEREADDVEGDSFNYDAVLVWDSPNKTRKKPIAEVDVNGNPLQDLRDGKL